MHDDLVLLPCSVDASPGLGVLLVAEGQPEPDHSVTPVLEVQPMTSRFWMQEQHRDLAGVPILHSLLRVLGL